MSVLREHSVSFAGSEVPYLAGAHCGAELVAAVLAAAPDTDRFVLVADHRVTAHAAPVLAALRRSRPVHLFTVTATERDKTLVLVERLLEFAAGCGASRRTVLVAMGGGLVGNVAGMAAALLFRGVGLVHLPTTPVAAFDAVLSLKQGVNLSRGKNMCGVYFQPLLIGVDFAWLVTVPGGEMLTGLAEMAKNVLAAAPDHRDTFEQAMRDLQARPLDAFERLCRIGLAAKLPFLSRDPRERDEALVFEYGHTCGHAVEFGSGGSISHGEAVAWGMLVAAELSRAHFGMSDRDVDLHHHLVSWLGLPPASERIGGFDRSLLRRLLAADNKRGYVPSPPGHVPMVLLGAAGSPLRTGGAPLVAVPEADVLAAFEVVAAGHAKIRSQRWASAAISGQRSSPS